MEEYLTHYNERKSYTVSFHEAFTINVIGFSRGGLVFIFLYS